MTIDDMDLVGDYVSCQSESAFAELVTRHTNLVYSTALRQSGDPHLAEEVTQGVFIILARKAASFNRKTIVPSWLYRTACFVSRSALKQKIARQQREQEAYMRSNLDETPTAAAWERFSPLLDEAMMRLNEADRNAIVLRFFEGRSLGEIGSTLGASEDAAKKRVSRALDRLRNLFAKRGVESTTETLSETISAHSIQPAPVMLAKTVAAIAFAKGAAAPASTLTLIHGAMKLMAWTKAKTAVVAVAALAVAAGTTIVGIKTVHWLRPQPDIRGAWEGVVAPQIIKLRVVLNVDRNGDRYHVTADSIDQRIKGIPVEHFKYDYPSISFDAPSVAGSFQGKFDAGVTAMTGTWKQPGLNTTLQMKHTATPARIPEPLVESDYAPRAGSDLQGYWKGPLKAGRATLNLVFKIAEPSESKFVAELDSLDQGAEGLIVSSLTYDRPQVEMEVGGVGGVFKGKLSEDGKQIAGTWSQGRSSLPLTIKRSDPAADREQAAAAEARKDYTSADPNDLVGHWAGALELKGLKLRLALHVAKMPDGTLSTTMDSLDQSAKGIRADVTRFNAPAAHLEFKTINGTFDGKLENGKLAGTWQQNGRTMDLAFERAQ
jgi:RNA polymerase sigma factor (sigma-70 family)